MDANTQMREYDMQKVLDLALEAGRILLKNGAEIFRVEETIAHICDHFRIEQVDTFVLSNGIFITATNSEKEVFAKVKHIPLSGIHLGIVTEVNDLSREISAGHVELEEAYERLREIDKQLPKRDAFRVFASGMGSAAFIILLKASMWEALAVFLIAMLLYLFVIFGEKHHMSKILTNIVGGAFITLCTLACANIPWPFILRIDKIIIGSIFPLVPGVGFTNAIRDIARSDFISGTVRMIDALLVFVYIAIGVGFVLSVYQGLLGGVSI